MKQKALSLTQAEIEGNDPTDTAWKKVLAHCETLRGKKRTEHIRSLPQHWRAVYTTFWLECEVNNGGHHQFFWNSEGTLNKETLEDLRLISAKPFILLFDEALDVFGTHDYVGDKRKSRNTWEAFTSGYKEKRMDSLDTAFYKAPKTIGQYLADYIRKNRELYRA